MEDAKFNQVFERLLLATNSKNDGALAVALGVSAQSVSQAKKKLQIPPQWIIDISIKNRISADWLISGVGSMDSTDSQHTSMRQSTTTERVVQQPSKLEVLNCFDCEIVMVPMVEAVLSAGNGSFETGGMTDRRYAFRSDFLRRKGSPSSMVLMRVSGDSMEPEIKHGDVVLIDQSQKRLLPNAIYAVGFEDMVYLKAINALPNKLVLTSLNEAYEPIIIDTDGDASSSLNIIGKAIWWCREA